VIGSALPPHIWRQSRNLDADQSKDGELISFTETLDLMKITRLIETARKKAVP